ncbi:hypothetical protein GCM10023084_76800 [Streptomyces lacrimifluminis]|uniref:Uncharacterized protein n=1 Tax=Streptomyces lacrimifluminis TaxID=1500077 RepID=A0A917P8Z3_9ACTN|nr:hypothetical protein GCM10012282_75220 [Streptomyces lacrimifluminis]
MMSTKDLTRPSTPPPPHADPVTRKFRLEKADGFYGRLVRQHDIARPVRPVTPRQADGSRPVKQGEPPSKSHMYCPQRVMRDGSNAGYR